MPQLVTTDDPRSVALYWYQKLNDDGRNRYDAIVDATGIDVADLSPWAQLTLAWLAGEERFGDSVVEIVTAARAGAVARRDAALSQLAGQTTLDDHLAEAAPVTAAAAAGDWPAAITAANAREAEWASGGAPA